MILEKVLDHGVETPDHVAIVDDHRSLTYREVVYAAYLFMEHINTLAPATEFGDKVGLLMPPSAAFVVSYGGVRWADRIAMPLNYLLKPEELVAIVKDSGVKIIFTIPYFQKLAEAIAAATGVKVVDVESLKFEQPRKRVRVAIAADSANLRKCLKPFPVRKPNDVAVLMYTSGTSGTPKGVMLTNENLESNAIDSCAHAHFTEQSVFLGSLPMFHAFGLMASVHIPLWLGSKVVYQSRFSPMGVFEAVKKHAVEVLVMVPTMYAVMAGAKNGSMETFKSVTHAICGGEPLPVTLIEQFKTKFGTTLLEGFGLTETSPIVAINMPWAYKAGSVGKVIPHMTVKTVDEDGHELHPGIDGGELWIKGKSVMKGYYNKPELTAEVLTQDKWFKTGDVAKIDEDGYLFITGRKKDMIIMAGEKVFPREIEDAIKQHPAVLVAAVIGTKDETRGEAPVAFVQLKPEAEKLSENDIRAWVRERIAPYKVPRNVHFLDQMPLGVTGKVLKRELKVNNG